MTKLEQEFKQVINGLLIHMKRNVCVQDDIVCPYFHDTDCYKNLMSDAEKLLKEQEAQPAIIEGSDVIRIGRCPSCKTVLQPWGANYCYNCGKAVKWNA